MAKYLNLKPVEFSALSAKRQAAVQWKGRLMLPKYDGCFCMVGFFDGKPNFILSRDGVPSLSMLHIYDDLLLRYPRIADTKGGYCFLGEAWSPGREFKDISGSFRRHSPQADLGYAVFDLVQYDNKEGKPMLYSNKPYSKRLELLSIRGEAYCHAYPPLPVECEDEAHAWRYANYLKKLGGYDGAVVSDPDATYVVSDGHGEFLKVKPLQSFSLEVVGIEPGVGKKTGRATATLVVCFKDGACGVGTGFSHEQAASWLATPALVVGHIIEVACMGVYDGPAGMMREPRFVGFRDDVINPDY